jgi:hypothetical protein
VSAAIKLSHESPKLTLIRQAGDRASMGECAGAIDRGTQHSASPASSSIVASHFPDFDRFARVGAARDVVSRPPVQQEGVYN